MGIDHALSLYLREQLTGRSLPPAANQVLSEWREWLDSDVSEKFKPDDFDVHDQQGFAEALKHLLRSLELDSGDENDAPDEFSDDTETPEDTNSSEDDDQFGDTDSTSMQDDGEAETTEDQGESEDGSDAIEPEEDIPCLLYTSPSPRDLSTSRMPSSA